MSGEFLKQFPSFKPSEARLHAERLAILYHDETEAFDRIVCTEKKHGDAFPANREQRRLIERNARHMFDKLAAKAFKEYGMSRTDFKKVVQEQAPR